MIRLTLIVLALTASQANAATPTLADADVWQCGRDLIVLQGRSGFLTPKATLNTRKGKDFQDFVMPIWAPPEAARRNYRRAHWEKDILIYNGKPCKKYTEQELRAAPSGEAE
jgi:hypothetical protein